MLENFRKENMYMVVEDKTYWCAKRLSVVIDHFPQELTSKEAYKHDFAEPLVIQSATIYLIHEKIKINKLRGKPIPKKIPKIAKV